MKNRVFMSPKNKYYLHMKNSIIAFVTLFLLVACKKNQELYEEYKKINSRFIDENLTLIEKKFNALKSNNTKAVDSLSALQDNNIKRKYLYATNFAVNNKDHEVSPYIALAEIYDINV